MSMGGLSNHSYQVWRARSERLSNMDKELLKPLYAGLKHLTDEEREFLMQKYYYPEKPCSDRKMAELTDLTLTQYTDKRMKIEAKVNKAIIDMENDQTNISTKMRTSLFRF